MASCFRDNIIFVPTFWTPITIISFFCTCWSNFFLQPYTHTVMPEFLLLFLLRIICISIFSFLPRHILAVLVLSHHNHVYVHDYPPVPRRYLHISNQPRYQQPLLRLVSDNTIFLISSAIWSTSILLYRTDTIDR